VECKKRVLEEIPQGMNSNQIDPAQNQLQGVLLRFQGNNETWEQISKECLLGYSKEKAGPIFGGVFDPEKPFFFEAVLCSGQLTLLSLMNDNVSEIKEHFLAGSIASELQNEKSYQLISVTQALTKNPNVQMGLTIDWS